MAGAPYARRGGKFLNSQRTSGIGVGKGIAHPRRHRKLVNDSIHRITKGDLRRLARRGGVKRISAAVYPTARLCLRDFLRDVWLWKMGLIVDFKGLRGVC
jgi:histone H4